MTYLDQIINDIRKDSEVESMNK